MKEKEKIVTVREKPDFFAIFKGFWSIDSKEVSEEEGILESTQITDGEKKALLKALKSVDKLGKETFSIQSKKETEKKSKTKSEKKIAQDDHITKVDDKQTKREELEQERI
jgi:hypothetical protein